ncbi:hypothetical protein, variant 2 [Exophiala mesophila]|uniref:C2H2-type domain-containing protein n=1 Tax=Exophiala mesophila TaxID=212818 RepID=A0A0D2ADT3_EXOME|nr:uncharacterized protein PV10_00833 [Exophiala mesophila]XP_016228602.1 hypothetical protein, variant 1 [Exophiala mesophila]XP_016228603.1 hypothetical protein, variant 2 [Exophiala mesophila]KIV97027.1 hypothetical protein PV10_00833 [Exophiala mesophila]KIV97028.1 hypothetical protein, variant 1 [Exophiala mesophila]KIV97029.1 hypothetical protein, variant 2 [Exophiala mesophila]
MYHHTMQSPQAEYGAEASSFDMPPHQTTSFDQSSPLTLTAECPELSPSFFSNDSSLIAGLAQRRSSIESFSSTSAPPELFFTPSAATTSPTTPMMVPSKAIASNTNLPKATCFSNYHPVLQLCGDHEDVNVDSWMGKVEIPGHNSHLDMTFGVHMSDTPGEDDGYNMLGGEYHGMTTMGANPALTKSIFDGTTEFIPLQGMDTGLLPWSTCQVQPPSQTIEPSATFQTVVSSSPGFKMEPSTPLHCHLSASTYLNSSPLPILSPLVVPSQHDVEEIRYEAVEQAMRSNVSRKCRPTTDRLFRRSYERKKLIGASAKPKPAPTKSGIDCDEVIPQNEFACSYLGCIDKNTMSQKRFKRREHMKRHEKTVHQSDKPYRCWVPDCSRAFSRSDNLKSHLRNTHSKKPGVRGNRYVATLDKGSDYYDPEWSGLLDKQGYPIL